MKKRDRVEERHQQELMAERLEMFLNDNSDIGLEQRSRLRPQMLYQLEQWLSGEKKKKR